MKLRCLNPGCGSTDFYAVRPVYEWRRGFRWWCFWRGVALYRTSSGDAAICSRCDCSQVNGAEDTYLTVKQALLNEQRREMPVRNGTKRREVEDEDRIAPVSLPG